MSYRWLQRAGLVAVVVAAFVVAPTVARAAAGLRVDDVACCCPDPSECHCHDHDDGDAHGDARLETCGHDGELLSMVVVLAVLPPPPRMPRAPRAVAAPPPRSVPAPEDRPSRPVTPPF